MLHFSLFTFSVTYDPILKLTPNVNPCHAMQSQVSSTRCRCLAGGSDRVDHISCANIVSFPVPKAQPPVVAEITDR